MKKYEKNELKEVVSKSISYNEVLKYFNRNTSSRSYQDLKNHLKDFDIDVSHFLTKSELTKLYYQEGKLTKLSNDEIFNENSKISRGTVKDRLIKDGLIPYKCILCGQDENWRGKKMSLILDHINGKNNDNRLVNLRFVCPNCNSTLHTHCKGIKGLKDTKTKKIKKRKVGDRTHTRKVERPEYEILIKNVNEFGYSSTGRKYGVSDNAIRKWIK
jgi:hypothetical protein